MADGGLNRKTNPDLPKWPFSFISSFSFELFFLLRVDIVLWCFGLCHAFTLRLSGQPTMDSGVSRVERNHYCCAFITKGLGFFDAPPSGA